MTNPVLRAFDSERPLLYKQRCVAARTQGCGANGATRPAASTRVWAGCPRHFANHMSRSHHERLGTPDLPGVILPNGFPLQQVPPAAGGHCEPAIEWCLISLR